MLGRRIACHLAMLPEINCSGFAAHFIISLWRRELVLEPELEYIISQPGSIASNPGFPGKSQSGAANGRFLLRQGQRREGVLPHSCVAW